jgi:hypothetical protein
MCSILSLAPRLRREVRSLVEEATEREAGDDGPGDEGESDDQLRRLKTEYEGGGAART